MKRLFLILFLTFSLQITFAQNGGYALQFDGVDDYVNIGDHASLQLSNSVTVEAWIYPTYFDPAGYHVNVIIEKAGSSGYGYQLRCGGNGQIEFLIGGSDWGSAGATSPISSLSLNTWTHVAGTYNGSTMKLFVNGKEVASTSVSITMNTSGFNGNIGRSAQYTTRLFKGSIDEVRIWSSARTEAQIKANMYKELAGNETGLVAYYKMSNGTGTTLADNKTSGTNTGTISGATWKASGAFAGSRQALDFDGSNDYVDFTTDPSYNNTAITIEAWIKPVFNNEEKPIVTWYSAYNNVIEFRRGSGRLEFGMNDGSFGAVAGNTTITSGNWTYVAMTKEGNNVKLYVNGVLDGSGTLTKTNAPSQFYIGYLPHYNPYFTGQIDEVRIWHEVRSESQIRENMMRNLIGNETNLVAYYRFDHYDGTTLYDMTANGYNGTLTNMDAATDWVSSTAFNTWIGSESSAWSTVGNWSRGSVPSATDNVGLYKWDLGSEAEISGTPGMFALLFASSSNPTISSNFNLNGNLILQRNINIGTNTVFLNNINSISNLVEGSYKLSATTGSIYTTKSLNNISNLNVAGLGATITTIANLGSTTIRRRHAQVSQGLSKSILRTYEISPTTNIGLNATLVFNYLDDELNGLNESNLKLYKSNVLGTEWTKQELTSINTTNNTATLTGIDGFSYWTLAESNDPLPVELTSFNAIVEKNNITLTWQTATEQNNYGFEVERSAVCSQNEEWKTIGFIEGNGNSNSPNNYSFTDNSPLSGLVKYRLKQIDNDGSFTYSESVEVEIENIPTEYTLYQNYPNPFNPSTTIKFGLPKDSHVILEIFNILGEKVATLINQEMQAGFHNFQFSIFNFQLSSGIYVYRLKAGEFVQSRKLLMIK
ncbi:MAG: T9SS type A sorting domain-containing protein [Ignavibacteriaceae bacterium]|nr:T9SS type A sorting domain-containing protein [Ignavibacteriaceae bacterium]